MALAVILKGPFQLYTKTAGNMVLKQFCGKIMLIISSLVLSAKILRMLILEMKKETLHRAVSHP